MGLFAPQPVGIFPDQGYKLFLMHWQADSLPLSHQGNPLTVFPPKFLPWNGMSSHQVCFRVNVLGSPSLAVFLLLRQSISVLELVAGGIPCSSPVSRLPPNCPLLSGAPLLSRLPLGLYASRSGAWWQWHSAWLTVPWPLLSPTFIRSVIYRISFHLSICFHPFCKRFLTLLIW